MPSLALFLHDLTFHLAIAFVPISLSSILLIVHNVSCSRLEAITSFSIGFEAIQLCIAVLNTVVALL